MSSLDEVDIGLEPRSKVVEDSIGKTVGIGNCMSFAVRFLAVLEQSCSNCSKARSELVSRICLDCTKMDVTIYDFENCFSPIFLFCEIIMGISSDLRGACLNNSNPELFLSEWSFRPLIKFPDLMSNMQ